MRSSSALSDIPLTCRQLLARSNKKFKFKRLADLIKLGRDTGVSVSGVS
jgi:hypothetical protein